MREVAKSSGRKGNVEKFFAPCTETARFHFVKFIIQSIAISVLAISSQVQGAISYASTNSSSATVSLNDDILAGIAPTGTATREGGDGDTIAVGLGSLTDGVTGTTNTGRSFVNPGTLDFDLDGTFDISTIYFRLVNAVVDTRLSFISDVLFSYDNGGSYSPIFSINQTFDSGSGEFAKTGTLSGIDGQSVTNIRFNMTGTGGFSPSFSEIDVVGTAVPELSQPLILFSLACFSALARRRR